jgi:hypothetical protein
MRCVSNNQQSTIYGNLLVHRGIFSVMDGQFYVSTINGKAASVFIVGPLKRHWFLIVAIFLVYHIQLAMKSTTWSWIPGITTSEAVHT